MVLEVVQYYHHFHERTQSMLGGKDVEGYSTLLKMSLMMYCNFEVGVSKINIFKVLVWEEREEGHKKGFSVHAFNNIDNSGGPLNQ